MHRHASQKKKLGLEVILQQVETAAINKGNVQSWACGLARRSSRVTCRCFLEPLASVGGDTNASAHTSAHTRIVGEPGPERFIPRAASSATPPHPPHSPHLSITLHGLARLLRSHVTCYSVVRWAPHGAATERRPPYSHPD